MVGAAFGLLLVTAPILVSAGSISWEQGFIHSIAVMADGFLPGNLDIPIVIGTGIFAGWLILFFIDSTKRVQTALLLPVGAVVIVLLQRLEHVIDAAARAPIIFISACLLSVLVTGSIDPQVRGNRRPGRLSPVELVRWIQFPIAARAMFLTLGAIIVLQIVQYPFLDHPPDAPSSLIVFLSGVGALVSIGVFVRYRSQRNVVTITPGGEAGRTALGFGLGGLYKFARRNYHASVVGGNQSETFEKVAENPAMFNLDFQGEVEFKYLPPDLLNRSILVQSRGINLDDIDVTNAKATINTGRFTQAIVLLRSYILRTVPAKVRQVLGIHDKSFGALLAADAVLLIIPLPDWDSDMEANITAMMELIGILHSLTRTDVLVVVTGAREALDDKEIDFDNREELGAELYNITSNYLEPAVNDETADIPDPSNFARAIYPVDHGDDTTEMTGYDAILRRL